MKKKIKQILKKINFIKVIIVLLYLVVAQLLWHLAQDYAIVYIVSKATTELQTKILYVFWSIAVALILTLILIALIITLKRHKKGIKNDI